jgi:hypothetical protein
MKNDPELSHFYDLRKQYFDVLCQSLRLVPGQTETGTRFAIASAALGEVRIFFEHDRGICLFSIGAFSDSHPLCSVEELAARFPRIRLMSEGHQRLTLEEQRSFVEGKWNELQVMFSPQHLPATRKWRQAAAADYMKRFSSDS